MIEVGYGATVFQVRGVGMVVLHISKLDGVWGVVEDILRQKRSDILIVDDSSVSSDEMQKADVVITYRFDWHLFQAPY